MLKYLPSVARQFQDAEATRKFTHLPRVAFRSPQIVGRSWAMLPSAAGFLDPLFSTGFPLTLLGVQRLARLLSRETNPSLPSLETYAAATQADLLIAADLVGALHYNLGRPAIFQALSMLYFAAATFSETTRRLGRTRRSPGFLLRGRPDFRQAIEELCRHSRRATLSEVEFTREVARAIEPVNVAGLINSRRRNWYPVDLSDLYFAKDKLGVDDAEISEMLKNSGITVPFATTPPTRESWT
jgi:FADH2 O2-dependent halogenase